MMAKFFGQKIKRQILPPNLLAFFAGIVLAMIVGMIFRKLVDKIDPIQRNTTLRAQSSPTPISRDVAPISSRNDQPKTQTAISDSGSDDSRKSIPNETSRTEKENKKTGMSGNVPSKSATVQTNSASTSSEEPETEYSPLGEVDYLAWRRLLRSVEEMLEQQGAKVTSATLTPRYRHQAKGLAITRGQFLDVVSRKTPANLPTRPSNQGLVLHALSAGDFDSVQFAKTVAESGTRLEPLCQGDQIQVNTEGIERITIIASNTQPFFRCLQDWLARTPNLNKVLEISFIGFTRGPTFFGSLTSEKKLISLQMWHPDWLVDNTVAMDETGRETLLQKRTLRLANVTRALGQPSDVRMQIPASTRSLSGPLVEPKDPTPAKPLIVGNFALVPSHMPRGSLTATAFTNPGQDRGKTVSVIPPGPGRARALVLATQGKKLQFMTVTRE